jgi:hypothetical protein
VVLVLFSCQHLDCPEELTGAMHLCRRYMDVKNWRFVVKCFSRNGKKYLINNIFPHFKNCLKKLPICQISISKTKKTTWLAGD